MILVNRLGCLDLTIVVDRGYLQQHNITTKFWDLNHIDLGKRILIHIHMYTYELAMTDRIFEESD